MSPGDPTDPTEILKSGVVAGDNSESTLVAVGHSGSTNVDTASSMSADNRIPSVGTKIGKYELIEKLGMGGMSVVFKARDLALDRVVALKLLLSTGGPDQIDTMRFQQEAKAASRLEHPNIVKVHDFNITEDGVPYLVMSYLEGVSLAAEIKKERGLQVGRWLAIMVQACDALTHAHENNVVHRDIKPSNFVLCQEKGTEVLKLVDFGIAKIETNDDQALTKTGEVFGSPMYMSPEQCSGSKVDLRSDVYSLGCVMYEALAGKPPLAGENSLATIVKHLQEKPESLANVCRDVKDIQSIDSIVMKCLEKKPEDRYPDTLSVRKDLERLFLGRSVKKTPVNARTKVAAAIAVVALCAVPFGYSYYQGVKKVDDEKAAALVKQKQVAEIKALRMSSYTNLKEDKVDLARKELLRALQLAIDSHASPVEIAYLNLQLGDCESRAQNRALARPYFLKAANMPLPLNDMKAVGVKYDAYHKLGHISKYTRLESQSAKPYYLKALEFARMMRREKPKLIVLLELSKIAEEEGNVEDAASYLKQAQAIKSDSEEIARSTAEFYGRHREYELQKHASERLNNIKLEKKKQKDAKREQEERAAAIERESDLKTDLQSSETKKKWGDVLLDTEKN